VFKIPVFMAEDGQVCGLARRKNLFGQSTSSSFRSFNMNPNIETAGAVAEPQVHFPLTSLLT
jgi:hypothetical protein